MDNNKKSDISSVKIRIPYPVVDSDDREAMRAFGTSPESEYNHNLIKIRDGLKQLGIGMTKPEPQPIEDPLDRYCIVTVPLLRGITADQVKTVLVGFEVEECNT